MLGGVFLCLLCIVVYLGSVGFVRLWGNVDTGERWLVSKLSATLDGHAGGLQRGIEKADGPSSR